MMKEGFTLKIKKRAVFLNSYIRPIPNLHKALLVTGKLRTTMKLIATFILTLTLTTGFAQFADNTDRHNDRNIYLQALKQYLDFTATDSFYSKLKQIGTLYVYKDTKTTDSLLNKIGTTTIVMIDAPYTFIKNRNGEGITLYSIFPLDFEKGEFWVSFVPFSVTIDKKRNHGLMFSNPGSYKVVYKYNSGHFVFVRLEDNGI